MERTFLVRDKKIYGIKTESGLLKFLKTPNLNCDIICRTEKQVNELYNKIRYYCFIYDVLKWHDICFYYYRNSSRNQYPKEEKGNWWHFELSTGAGRILKPEAQILFYSDIK